MLIYFFTLPKHKNKLMVIEWVSLIGYFLHLINYSWILTFNFILSRWYCPARFKPFLNSELGLFKISWKKEKKKKRCPPRFTNFFKNCAHLSFDQCLLKYLIVFRVLFPLAFLILLIISSLINKWRILNQI